MKCQPGELELADGRCQPAGVPPEMCGEGFEPDGKMGCNAILPAEACPFGLMAVPGETECREVAPCGEGKWGDIPVDETTQFVDGAYAGNDSDGTKERPWKTIQEGIDAADPGAVVAVAEGTYYENLLIKDRSVQLWGVCPKKVTVTGTGNAASIIIDNSDSAQVNNVAITGQSTGIDIRETDDVVIRGVWIHDTHREGLHVPPKLPKPASIQLSRSLIEKVHGTGLLTFGALTTATEIAVRDVQPTQFDARGINVIDSMKSMLRGGLTLRRSLIERFPGIGVHIQGSDASVESSVVRDCQRGGILADVNINTKERAALTMSQAVLAHNSYFGIRVSNSYAAIDTTMVLGTRLNHLQRATGVVLEYQNGRSDANIAASVIDGSEKAGMEVAGSTAELKGTIIRNTRLPYPSVHSIGMAIYEVVHGKKVERSQVNMRGSIFEDNEYTGVQLTASSLVLDETIISNQQGYGLYMMAGTKMGSTIADTHVQASLFENNGGMGSMR
ncbi:MAG: right-handed parallel beta-helix repeat-containing protein, partial [Polyangiaceae bacterium]|nr:right-handed parallel beta-helix repeat-containing protein [Polyangiaceae bacterium]